MESFLRGNLQVQFGGRRASTLPYEYSDYNSSDEQSLTFDSYTIPEDDLELGQSRLLEVDNRVVLPAKSHIRFIVTSADVPHSWAVPSLGVKCDAVPGRLNQTSISVQREGVYYEKNIIIEGASANLPPTPASEPVVELQAPQPDKMKKEVTNEVVKGMAHESGKKLCNFCVKSLENCICGGGAWGWLEEGICCPFS